jgi:hypothetical protein
MKITNISTFIEINKTQKKEKKSFGSQCPDSAQPREQAQPNMWARGPAARQAGPAWPA